MICVHLNTENKKNHCEMPHYCISSTRGSFPKDCYLNKMNFAFGERKNVSTRSFPGRFRPVCGSAETVFLEEQS